VRHRQSLNGYAARAQRWSLLDSRNPRSALQKSPIPPEYFDKIVYHRPHAGNICEITSDEKPYVSCRRAAAQGDFHQVGFMCRHDISWQKRDAISSACCSRLRRLAVGAERKSLVGKMPC